MKLITLDKKQQQILYIGTFVVVALGIVFLRNYISLILFAAIMAILFMPMHDRYIQRGKKPATASFYTFAISSLVVTVPLLLVIVITIFQLNNLIMSASAGDYTIDITELSASFVEQVNYIAGRLGLEAYLTTDDVVNAIQTFSLTISRQLFEWLVNSFTGLFGLVTGVVIYIYVFLSMLQNKEKLIDLIKKLNPLGDEVSRLYISRASDMTKATVRGQFIIAFVQGFASALVLSLVGPSNLFFFFLFLLTVMSVIPLGAGIVTIPIGFIIILTGNIWGGALVIANHLLFVTNIDNILRPKLVPASARLDPALMILAVFSGLALFGFLGIVLGPVIMILIVTTLQIYQEVFYKKAAINVPTDQNKSTLGLKNIAEKTTAAVNKILE